MNCKLRQEENFLEKYDFLWSKLVGCQTGGATAMLGRKSGFQSHVKAMTPSVISFHCFKHRFTLAAKLLPPNLKKSLNLVVKMVNYINTSVLNSRLFKDICENIESEFLTLLFDTI